ncbi:MAG TPA: restriction endonuclease subunit S, partial [Campylobacterales bacterium]|nr:restriction endonuclease subunit S [Campylobacterales bacterium]
MIDNLPSDWKIDIVKNHCKITTGSKNTQDAIKDGDYPFFVRSQTIESINTFSFDGEAVLTAGDGVGVGKVFHYINGKFDYHQRVYNMHSFSNQLDGKFFYLYF